MWHTDPARVAHYRVAMAPLTRGPLPARVYWRRRVAVLGTAFMLLFGTVRLATGGAGEPTGEGTVVAVQSAGSPTRGAVAPAAEPRQQGAEKRRKDERKDKQKDKQDEPKEPVLAEPEGDCVDTDVAVTPAVEQATAGRPVMIVLELRTALSPACTWRVSPDTLTVKVTSGEDDIWFSRQCPRAVPTRDVVVRKEVSTTVGIRWSGRRSDRDCTRYTDWAMPGWYHVTAAAFAGEPSDVQFQLQKPEPEVVVAEPEKDRKKDRTKPRDKHVPGPGQR